MARSRAAAHAVLEQQGFSKMILDFVGVVASNRRLPVLRAIVAAFAALVAQKRGVVVATVASAHKLTDVQREQLRARLIEAGYGSVNIQETVDPTLLGGIVVRVGARLYDTSLKSRLQRPAVRDEGSRLTMDIRPAEISEILKQQIATFDREQDVAETGQVLSVGDGIARGVRPAERDGR